MLEHDFYLLLINDFDFIFNYKYLWKGITKIRSPLAYDFMDGMREFLGSPFKICRLLKINYTNS